MTPREAAAVFQQFGVRLDELATQVGIRAARNRLLMATHSDHTHAGDDAAARLNVAYDVLKLLPSGYYELAPPPAGSDRAGLPGSFHDRRVRDVGPPSGGTDRRGRPNRRDPADITQHLWELSGYSRQEYELFYFDGQLRPPLSVFGAPTIFPQMAKAVRTWVGPSRGFGHRAVFVRAKGEPTLLLIQLDGVDLTAPVPFAAGWPCDDPVADATFLRGLPGQIAAVARVAAVPPG